MSDRVERQDLLEVKTVRPMTPVAVPSRLYAGLFVLSAATLLLELTLTRVFDVLFWSNLSYLIVSSAMFGFGLAGVFLLLWPLARVPTERLVTLAATAFATAVLLLVPVLMLLPRSLVGLAKGEPQAILPGLVRLGTLYLVLLGPFFASGLAVSAILSRNAARVHRLYFWDLIGAGVGCLGVFGLPRLIGGEATLLLITAAGGSAAALFAGRTAGRARLAGPLLVGVALACLPFGDRIHFRSFGVKRGVDLTARDRIEFTRWDPVSRIDVLHEDVPWRKRIAYNGGSQSSAFYAFDGDYARLRERYFEVADGQSRHNSGTYLALCHWLKRDRGSRTLVIGSAGGQETLAALTWGASHVDAVEMVRAVIDAGQGPFSGFVGDIFRDPRVAVYWDEGRSFLRRTEARYDIIQIHSNHTTSSIANGAGGTDPIYLQTVEAYKEYFSHLTSDGILQINYFIYPRMITTAAAAWAELFPGDDFRRHLVVTTGYGTMTTFLVKRSPWTPEEVAAIRRYLSPEFAVDPMWKHRILFAPGSPEESAVPNEFFRVPLDPAFVHSLPYQVTAPSDDRPFFRELRRGVHQLEPDAAGYVPEATASFLNASAMWPIPWEHVHLYALGGMSLFASFLFVAVPLVWLRRRGLRHRAALPGLAYFSALGCGFVMVELGLMLKLVLVIGFPIYALATVLLSMLVFAGIGSWVSERVERRLGKRAIWVLAAFALALVALLVAYPRLSALALGMGQLERILFVAACLLPISLPLGMPFPIGIAALHARAPDLVPWAWGVNGFMTVVGSLLAVALPTRIGFNMTLLVAIAIYGVAVLSYPRLRASGYT